MRAWEQLDLPFERPRASRALGPLSFNSLVEYDAYCAALGLEPEGSNGPLFAPMLVRSADSDSARPLDIGPRPCELGSACYECGAIAQVRELDGRRLCLGCDTGST